MVEIQASPGQRLLPPLTAAMTVTIFSIAALALPLAVVVPLELSSPATGTWLFALYAVPGLLSVVLSVVYRQPLLVAWHTAVLVFLAGQASRFDFPQLAGATLVGGAAIALLGATGLTGRVARLVPAPVVFGVVAGSVLPFVERTFDALGEERFIVGAAFAAWLATRWRFGPRVPPVLPALIVGVAAAALAERLRAIPGGWALPALEPIRPHFTVAAIVTVAPVVVALVALHANLTVVTYLRSAGWHPPVRAIEVATGVGSVVGSFFGPVPVCMGALRVPLTAGPEAGERSVRVWAVHASAAGLIAIGLLGGVAAGIPTALPLALLLAVAGLALVGVLGQALDEITRGPLRLGPLLAFAVTGSHLSLGGLGAPFWALVLGTLVVRLLERQTAPTG